MAAFGDFPDIGVDLEGHIATVEIQRPPHNYISTELVHSLALAYEALDQEPQCRAIVLAAAGLSFCAGADWNGGASGSAVPPPPGGPNGRTHAYHEGARLMQCNLPVVAAIQGAAIGGGMGLALTADFRIASPEARFVPNFARLAVHHGFGMTVTLPALVGQQAAMRMLLTGKSVHADEALRLGLADELVPTNELRDRAHALAAEIAEAAPLTVRSIRRTMRRGLVDRFREATDHEQIEQDWQRQLSDFAEGVAARREHRTPNFQGR